MPLWIAYIICSIFFLVVGFLGTWAIREGGSFAFLTPSYWKKDAQGLRVGKAGRDRRP